ncbi:MAG: lactate utilization protein [Candidatus Omnitrophica bacterium]|nr:lactate utilization protein [Candidatus Omnitrophota bacterium]
MVERINALLKNWQKRNISGFYFPDKEKAIEKILELIPSGASIGISGSQTIAELDIVDRLSSRGNCVFDQYKKGLTLQESRQMRQAGIGADFYLTSANAISENGELVFFSAFGQRIAGIANARNVIVICGINKLAANLQDAVKRAREYVTPLNCRRLEWNTPCVKDGICRNSICLFPEYKRMCCQVLIIEAETAPDRLKVFLIGQPLGF